ncbi:MAG: hypothetical protein N2110_04630 [Flavobacteriales bacterium]|nr:hypothetical protein [Flavobacteriales bacterium]MCX7768295.1 hypothetical protein [Flavobacteriales bacterium]MDW8409923.1 hypothetical protein [Flavobacteriales bacterium]
MRPQGLRLRQCRSTRGARSSPPLAGRQQPPAEQRGGTALQLPARKGHALKVRYLRNANRPLHTLSLFSQDRRQ